MPNAVPLPEGGDEEEGGGLEVNPVRPAAPHEQGRRPEGEAAPDRAGQVGRRTAGLRCLCFPDIFITCWRFR